MDFVEYIKKKYPDKIKAGKKTFTALEVCRIQREFEQIKNKINEKVDAH